MTALWASNQLSAVPVDPRILASHIATDLGQHTSAVIEVVRLHLEALDSAFALDAPELLADQQRWQQVRLLSAGATVGRAELDDSVRRALGEHLDVKGRGRLAELQERAVELAAATPDEPGVRLADGPAQDYLTAALRGRRDDALAVVRDALRAETDVAEIMLGILQPAQLELGRLWEEGEISIAHEHYTTAITQLALSLLYPRLLLTRSLTGHSLVATAVGLEAHEVGIRMISDLLEQAGWRTTYLGADLPHEDVVERVAEQRVDVLAVSVTMAGHVAGVRELIAAVRADPRCERVRVLVGGRPFTRYPDLASRVGADGWAVGAREALALCGSWMGESVGAG